MNDILEQCKQNIKNLNDRISQERALFSSQNRPSAPHGTYERLLEDYKYAFDVVIENNHLDTCLDIDTRNFIYRMLQLTAKEKYPLLNTNMKHVLSSNAMKIKNTPESILEKFIIDADSLYTDIIELQQ